MENKKDVKSIVKKAYSEIAVNSGNRCSCGCKSRDEQSAEEISKSIGYTDEDMNRVPEANLGLGCGNPTAFGMIMEGYTVLDLGSGAGFDCFIASRKVGRTGRVIGVDMTEAMIKKARGLAEKYNYSNVEFRQGDIEDLPVESNSVDVIISNCVINLSPDKAKVFREAYRVLKDDGRMFVSDIVLLGELTDEQRNNDKLLSGCVAGALPRQEYLNIIERAGFKVRVIAEDKEISKSQYDGIPLESLKTEATKEASSS